MKQKALFGLLSGVGLVVATLVAVAALNAPIAQGASPADDLAAPQCAHVPDQGYGVVQPRHACAPIK
jgi:hypothetical protein